MRSLSIAVVRQRFAQDGGAERFVARMLETLKGQAVQATLVTREWQMLEDATVIELRPFYVGRLWRDWSFARAVCRLLAERRFDLVQSHERIACCDIYRAGDGVHREWLRQLARVRGPLGRLGIAINPYHLFVKRAERKLFTSTQLRAVICNSQMVKEEIRHYYSVPEAKLHVIYNGVDTVSFHPAQPTQHAEIRASYGIPEEATLFLFVGSGFERKGVEVLLAAMAQLPDTAYLLIVGRDKRSGHYERRARDLGVGKRVFFVGSQPDVRPFYGAADALVLPTLYDPGANVVLEAMACGLPVVTSSKNGLAEIIEEGTTGFVCDALDLAGIVNSLTKLLVAENRHALRIASRIKAEEFSYSKMTQALRDLYQNTLSIPA